MLRRFGIIAVLSLIVAALAAVPALAPNPHEVPSGDPITCTASDTNDDGQFDTVGCFCESAGLGNVDAIQVTIDATGGCATDNQLRHEPRGHIQSTSAPIPVSNNGRANISQSVSVDCPPGLNEVIGDQATVTVFEAGNPDNVLFKTTEDVIFPTT